MCVVPSCLYEKGYIFSNQCGQRWPESTLVLDIDVCLCVCMCMSL